MITVRNGEFLGLPVPDERDHVLLEDYLWGDGQNLVETGLVHRVLEARPAIRELVEIDQVDAINEATERKAKSHEIEALADGLEEGYRFTIDMLTYAYFLKSGHTKVKSFMSQLPKDSIALPLRRRSQFNRVRKYITNEAELEPKPVLSEDRVMLEYDLFPDADAYLAHVPIAADLIKERQVVCFSDKSLPEGVTTPGEDGFLRGVHHCISMYVQSHEQGILNRLR